jgi:hypothetical protein
MSDPIPTFSTVAELRALIRARNTGTLRVTVENRTTEFRSYAELLRVIAAVTADLEAAGLIPPSAAPSPSRRIRVLTTKGL